MKDGFVKVAACTPKIKVADVGYNVSQITRQIESCKGQGVKIAVFPELCITGATCGDLFYQEILLKKAMQGLIDIAKASQDYDALVIVGLPVSANGRVYNCAGVIKSGEILGFVPKVRLSRNERAFTAYNGSLSSVSVNTDGVETEIRFGRWTYKSEEMSVGFGVGEDLSDYDIYGCFQAEKADIICNLSASCELVGRKEYRRQVALEVSSGLGSVYILASCGEGESTQDMVFSGHNIIAENGEILAESDLFKNGITVSEIDVKGLCEARKSKPVSDMPEELPKFGVEFDFDEKGLKKPVSKMPFIPDDADERAQRCNLILQMQAQALKKRIEHTNAKSVVIGISGGLDSCLALLVCVEAMDLLSRSRTDVIAITMPCFGTTKRTRSNAEILCNELGVTFREINIAKSVLQHFEDIGHDPENHDVVFENAQARERTKVIMDVANQAGGFVVGTGDLSELALGWATYNGDHMSMYGVNASIPKTLIRHIVSHYGNTCENRGLGRVLLDIVDTPVSPELLPTDQSATAMNQKTEDLVGPYELHDFFLYYGIRWGFTPTKVYGLAKKAFGDDYSSETILKWLRTFYRRFFSQQFKRSCLPDGPKIGSLSLSPRGDWAMPSDAMASLWLEEIDGIKE